MSPLFALPRRHLRAALPALIAAAALLPLVPAGAHAAGPRTWTVDSTAGVDPASCPTSSPYTFATIGAAVNCAASGDTISLGAGTFSLAVSTPLNVDLTIKGQGAQQTDIDASAATGSSFTVSAGAAVTLSGLTLENGPALVVDPGAAATLDHVLVTHTGGLSVSGTLNLQFSTLTSNFANGAVSVTGTGAMLSVADSTIDNNYSIAVAVVNGAAGTVTNSTISDNYGLSGAALLASSATLAVRNSTISGNQSGALGGGIAAYGTADLTLDNTLDSGNRGSGGQPGDCATTQGTDIHDGQYGHNLIGVNGGCPNLASHIDGDLVGTPQAPVNPILGPLNPNGGTARTRALGTGSPAIGAGAAALCAQFGGTDERGISRQAAARAACDIGAYDTAGSAAAPGAPYDITTQDTGPGQVTVQWMVAVPPSKPVNGSTFSPQTGNEVTIIPPSACTAGSPSICSYISSGLQPGPMVYQLSSTNAAGAGPAVTFTIDPSASPQTWTVNLTHGVNPKQCPATGPFTFDSIAAAVACSQPGDTINIDAGSYTLSSGVSVPRDLTIKGASTGQTIVQGANLSTGAAFTVAAGAHVSLSGLTLTNFNTLALQNDGTLTLTNAEVSYSGGIESSGVLSLERTTVDQNFGGPGLQVSGSGATVTVENSTFNGGILGGIVLTDGASGLVANSTFYGNAELTLGAVGVSGASLTVESSTISTNVGSGLTGGVGEANGGTMVLDNTIVAGNINGYGHQSDCYAADAAAVQDGIYGHNLIGANTNCSLTDGVDGDRAGTPAAPIDPMLASPASNGGSTITLALLAGSPAIGAGSPAACAAAPVAGLDQRGIARTSCDIGAYAYPQTITASPIARFTVSRHAGVLRFTWGVNRTAVLLGFKLTAGGVRLNRTLITAHAGTSYRVQVRSHLRGPYTLTALSPSGVVVARVSTTA